MNCAIYFKFFKKFENKNFLTILKGQCHESFFKLRPRGVRLDPLDVPEPLFEFLYPPFNLLQYFKDGVHKSKI